AGETWPAAPAATAPRSAPPAAGPRRQRPRPARPPPSDQPTATHRVVVAGTTHHSFSPCKADPGIAAAPGRKESAPLQGNPHHTIGKGRPSSRAKRRY